MSETDHYERWKRRRRAVEIPPKFATRVMSRLEDSRDVTSTAALSRAHAIGHRIWNGCIAASVLAACIGFGMLRVQALLAFVLVTSSEGL
jgi:hypothetical protein